jgi:hypothetical protein
LATAWHRKPHEQQGPYKRQAERAAEHRRREKERRGRDRAERTPDAPAKPQSLRDYLLSLGWVDETSDHLGETITIIGAPPQRQKKPASDSGL